MTKGQQFNEEKQKELLKLIPKTPIRQSKVVKKALNKGIWVSKPNVYRNIEDLIKKGKITKKEVYGIIILNKTKVL